MLCSYWSFLPLPNHFHCAHEKVGWVLFCVCWCVIRGMVELWLKITFLLNYFTETLPSSPSLFPFPSLPQQIHIEAQLGRNGGRHSVAEIPSSPVVVSRVRSTILEMLASTFISAPLKFVTSALDLESMDQWFGWTTIGPYGNVSKTDYCLKTIFS